MLELLTERLLTLFRLSLPFLILYPVATTIPKIPYLQHYPVTTTLLIGLTFYYLYRFIKQKLGLC